MNAGVRFNNKHEKDMWTRAVVCGISLSCFFFPGFAFVRVCGASRGRLACGHMHRCICVLCRPLSPRAVYTCDKTTGIHRLPPPSFSLSLSIRRSVSLVQKGFYAPLRRPFAIACFHRAAHGSTVLLLLLLLLLLQPPPARRGLSAGFRGDGAQINCGCDHRDKER